MKSIRFTILLFCLLLLPALARATTYHTRFTVDFTPPYDNSLLILQAQMNYGQVYQWNFTGNSWLDTTFTHTVDANDWPGYEVFKFCALYYDDVVGYQPLLSDVHQWYGSYAPIYTLNLNNYWTRYHVFSNDQSMYIPVLDAWPVAVKWETWAVADAVVPPPTSPVPEPGTLVLLLVGGLAAASVLRFKNPTLP